MAAHTVHPRIKYGAGYERGRGSLGTNVRIINTSREYPKLIPLYG